MQEFLEIGGLLLFSATKFFLAPSLAIYLGFSFFYAVIITSLGGSLGFILFFQFGTYIRKGFQALFKRKAKPKFNKRNKMIVRVKVKYGFWGLVLLTPCLFSIPLGAFIASAYYSKRRGIIPIFFSSIFLWSVLLSFVSTYF